MVIIEIAKVGVSKQRVGMLDCFEFISIDMTVMIFLSALSNSLFTKTFHSSHVNIPSPLRSQECAEDKSGSPSIV